jgi:hypothetical protein
MSSPRNGRPDEVRKGVQRPRILAAPDYETSWGPETVELCAAAGLVLDPWQQFCLEVGMAEDLDNPDLWAAFEAGVVVPRQNGKGELLMARELGGLFVVGERLIVHTAHEFKTAGEAFVRVSTLIENCDMLRKRVKQVRLTTGQEGIQLLNGAWLKFLARSKGSGRGFTGDLVILDEAQILGDGPVRALVPTLSARPNPQIWYAGTAGTELSVQLGSVRNRALKGGDPSLAYLEWSVDETDYDPADPAEWAKANPAFGIRISEDYIRKERAVFTGDPAGFAAERLGVGDWPSEDGHQVISVDQWHACFDPGEERPDPVCFSVDVNPERSAAAVAVSGRRSDGLIGVELAEHKPGVDWVVGRVVELVGSWRPLGVVIDRSGPAGSLIAPLETAFVDAGLDPELLIVPTGQEVAQAAAGFYDEAIEGVLRHPGDPRLDAAVAAAIQLPKGDAWIWARRKSRGDVCPLVAASFARWGFLRQEQTVGQPSAWVL